MKTEQPPTRTATGCAWLAVSVVLLAWGCLAWTGWSLWQDTRARVPDSPYLLGQWRYYVGIPLLMTLIGVILAAVLWRRKLRTDILVPTCVVLLFALLPYLIPYTGGV